LTLAIHLKQIRVIKALLGFFPAYALDSLIIQPVTTTPNWANLPIKSETNYHTILNPISQKEAVTQLVRIYVGRRYCGKATV
jgi:hypothetical protein